MKAPRIPQFEMQWGEPEPFRLEQYTVTDWARVQREREELERQRAAFESAQVEFGISAPDSRGELKG